MVAWTLLVVSTDQQSDTLDAQQVWAELKAAEKGWTIGRHFKDHGTGKKGVRKLVRDLLKAVQETPKDIRPQWLLTLRADRIGRGDPVESLVWIRDICDLGVRIWTRYPDEEVEIKSLGGFLKSSMFAALARAENETKREKMTEMYAKRKRDGLPIGNCMPYGLKRVKNSQPTVIEDQAETVREIFRLRADGYGVDTIFMRVGPTAAPARYVDGRIRPAKWTRTKVQEILDRDIYCPLIVDEITFARARKIGIENHRPFPARKNFYPLTGVIRCYCGMTMVGAQQGGGRSYRCRNVLFHSQSIIIRSNKLESEFLVILKDLAADKNLSTNFKQRVEPEFNYAPALKAASSNLEAVSKKLKRLFDLYAEGEISKGEMQPSIDAFTLERDRLQALIADLKMRVALESYDATEEANVKALLERCAATYLDASPEDQRLIVQSVQRHSRGLYMNPSRHLQEGKPEVALVSE